MIRCNQIKKQYDSQPVFDGLSCCFEDHGFYLLLGESGSGKTSFLNILAGLIGFESGSIDWDGKTYENRVVHEENDAVEYITQDCFFVDFLSVMDNLRLLNVPDEQIRKMLIQFGLEGKEEQSPLSLSGGEKQRLALVRSLLKGKRILLLDEPTAALDEANKETVFQLLRQLSRDRLIICASHDVAARDHADVVLHFSKDNGGSVRAEMVAALQEVTHPGNSEEQTMSAGRKEPLRHYLKKWMNSGYRERKSGIRFVVFLTLSLCLLSFADTYAHKNDVTADRLYHANVISLLTYDEKTWDTICPSDDGILEVVTDYNNSCPIGVPLFLSGSVQQEIKANEYSVSLNVLPASEKSCKIAGNIKYGRYFTAPEQVILSFEMAEEMSGGDPEALLGKTIEETIYGLGTVELEIVGIFDKLNDVEKNWLRTSGTTVAEEKDYSPDNWRTVFFVNNALLEPLEDDMSYFSESGGWQRGYRLYFDSYKDAKDYMQKYGAAIENAASGKTVRSTVVLEGMPLRMRMIWPVLSYVLLPLAGLIAMLTVLFYAQMHRTEFAYNNSFVSVFEYAGHKRRDMLRALTGLCFAELMKQMLLAAVITFTLMIAVNMLNHHFVFLPVEIFSFNPWILGGYTLLIPALSLLSLRSAFRRVNVRTWYENLTAGRDLL